MGFFSLAMLGIALDLALEDPSYEDMASKFFEHFVAIVDAMNALGGALWNLFMSTTFFDYLSKRDLDPICEWNSVVKIISLSRTNFSAPLEFEIEGLLYNNILRK